MERRCETCPLRASCVEICPEIAAQLPREEVGPDRFARSDATLEDYHEFQNAAEHVAALRALADCLTLSQRRAFDLYYNDGLSHEAIGTKLSITASAVAKRLVAARERIMREAIRRQGLHQ